MSITILTASIKFRQGSYLRCKIHESLLRCPECYRPGSNLNKAKREESRIRLPLVTGLLEGTSKVLIEELPVPVENCKKKFWSKEDLFNTELTKPVAASVLFLSHQKTFLFILVLVVVVEFFSLGCWSSCCCWVAVVAGELIAVVLSKCFSNFQQDRKFIKASLLFSPSSVFKSSVGWIFSPFPATLK